MAAGENELWRLVAHCRDRPGINATVFSYLARHGANIVQADQHVTQDAGAGEASRYFVRAEIDPARVEAPLDEVARGFSGGGARRPGCAPPAGSESPGSSRAPSTACSSCSGAGAGAISR